MNESDKMNRIIKMTAYAFGIPAMILSIGGLAGYLITSYNFGTLNPQEWREIREERYRQEQAKDYFKNFDTDKDKKISIGEFFEKYPKKSYKNHVPFNEYDLNQDKVIDTIEFVKVFPGRDNF